MLVTALMEKWVFKGGIEFQQKYGCCIGTWTCKAPIWTRHAEERRMGPHLAAHDEGLVAAQGDAAVLVRDGRQLAAVLAAEGALLRRLERRLLRRQNLRRTLTVVKQH